MSSEDEDMECEYQSDASEEETPSSFPQALPSISQAKYNTAYDNFQKWNMVKGTTPITESVLIKYFMELAERNKPSTLYAFHSMLKATLRINDRINISSWWRLRDYLKSQYNGFKPGKAKSFSRNEIEKFINEAPDDKFLDLKVVCIFAINGVYGSNKFVNAKVEHIKQYDDMILVSIPNSEANRSKIVFTITGTFFNIVRKYIALRSKNTNDNRFFLQLRDGKCSAQNIGKNTFAGMPRRIAKYLKLPEVERYSGLSLRMNSDQIGAPTCVEQRNECSTDYETINREISPVIHTANLSLPVGSKICDLNNCSDAVMDDGSSNQFTKIEFISSEDDDEDIEYLPDTAEEVENTLSLTTALPSASLAKYNVAYNNFQKWNMEKGAAPVSESVLMKYFMELSEKNKPTSLWAYYSMLKATLRVNDNIDISSYSAITGFLKKQSTGYTPDKAKLFTRREIEKFINEAPDVPWLCYKVVCIFSINGAYSSSRLTTIKVDHVKQCKDFFLVTIPKTETSAKFIFTITGSFYNVVRKYVALRTQNTKDNRFFLQYIGGRCRAQNIGRNTFVAIPRRIAKYLKLEEPERYSGTHIRVLTQADEQKLRKYFVGYSFRIHTDEIAADTSDLNSTSVTLNYQRNDHETPSVSCTAIDPLSTASFTSNDIGGNGNDAVMSDRSSNQLQTIEIISSEDEDMEYRPDTPEDEVSTLAHPTALPSALLVKYNSSYNCFRKWNMANGAAPVSESVLMKYFIERSGKSKPNSLWAMYSMLKTTLKINDNIDISSYSTLIDFFKKQSAGYKSNKPKVFTKEEIEKFISEACDEDWLHFKVACIFAINGRYILRSFTNINIEHVKQYDDMFLVTMPKTVSTTDKLMFTINGTFFDVVRSYVDLRSKHTNENRFFLHYRNGKCIAQPMGKNAFCVMPRKIAKYLKLPEVERYSGYSFRLNADKLETAAGNLNSTSATDDHSAQRIEHNSIPQIERPSNLKKPHETPSVSCTSQVPVIASVTSNYYTGSEHVCSVSCGRVKCATEGNETSVLHAFTLMKPPDYEITDVIPAQFASAPCCRWIVSYTHTDEPVSPFNADETFDVITTSIPNNVRIHQKYITRSSSHHSAAYVVIYGVNCRCHKQSSSNVVNFAMNGIKCEI